MEFLLLLAFIIVIILLSLIRSHQKDTAQRNEQLFNSLKKDLLSIKEDLEKAKAKEVFAVKEQQPAPKPTDENVLQWKPYVPPPVVEKLTSPAPKEEDIPAPYEEEKITPVVTPVRISPPRVMQPAEPAEGWWEKWVRNNPDMEKFVGENLANKIGIAVLVLGIAFFVKYAIDQNWIKEGGRVAIGIGCGIILIGIAHYLRNTYRSFSSVLAGGGIAVFYFTIAFAFHEYDMFGQTKAFIIMVVITAFAVALSLLYDKLELAVIAVVGGFLVPFLVSNGSGNYVVLFTYLLILNIGILSIAYFKKWPLLHILAFFFTLIIYGGWLIQQVAFINTALPYKNALLFAAAFYLVFLAITLIHNLRTQKPFRAFDFSLLMMITFSFYAEGMFILAEWNNGAYQGIFTIVMSVINLCLAWYLYVTHKGDKNLLYLLIGLTLTFLSLAAPVQLHGHSITMFWAAEAVLLYWLHQRSKIGIFKYSSAIILLLMMVSLLMDWSMANGKGDSSLPLIFNNWKGIVTNMVVIISLGLYAFLLLKPAVTNEYLPGLKNKETGITVAALSAVVFYVTCIFAVNLHFEIQQTFDIPNVYHQLISYAFIAVILLLLNKLKLFEKPIFSIVFILAGFVLYLFNTMLVNNLVTGVIENHYAAKHLYMHWLADIALLYLLYQLVVIVRANHEKFGNGFTWLINIILLIFFSIECRYLYVTLLAGEKTIPVYAVQYIKAGLTIVWALFSFTIMWLGMKYKYKTLRIISLSFFTAALIKLFLFDIRNVSAGGKIAAFIMLGVLLLVISFMYQRLKKIIIDHEEKNV
jgi:uncharacterized membrane protein